MQKDLLKLALTGLAAGICLSAQEGAKEIAMSKCSRTPTADEVQYPNDRVMDRDQMYKDEMNEHPDNDHQSDTCAASCGNQMDQTSLNAPRLGSYMETKRLSAAKAAIEAENNSNMDK